MNDNVLEMERLIPAPPERLFEYWTEPELVAKWFGPGDFDVSNSQLDLRPGGQWRTTIRSPEGKLRTVSGVYSAIDPPRRLVFTWAWDDDDGVRGHETQVTVTLEPTPGGTRLRLVQEDFQNRELRDRHNGGWASSLSKLQQLAGLTG